MHPTRSTTCTPGHTPTIRMRNSTVEYRRMVLRYWRDAGSVRGTTSQLRRLRLIARTARFSNQPIQSTYVWFVTAYAHYLRVPRRVDPVPCFDSIRGDTFACRSADGTISYTCCTAFCLPRCVTNPTRRGTVSNCTLRALPTPVLTATG